MRTITVLLAGLLYGMIVGYVVGVCLVFRAPNIPDGEAAYRSILSCELAGGLLGVLLADAVVFPRDRRRGGRPEAMLPRLLDKVRSMRGHAPGRYRGSGTPAHPKNSLPAAHP